MTAATSPAAQYGLDTPRPFAPTQNYFQLIGWAFVPGNQQLSQVRIRVIEATPHRDDNKTDAIASSRSAPVNLASAKAPDASVASGPAAERVFFPEQRIERPDVASSFPTEPRAGTSGFKFICYLPFGFYIGELEVWAEAHDPQVDGSWLRVCTLPIPVSSHPILGAIEYPPPQEVITKPVRVEGWCFHPEFVVRDVVLQFGNVEVPCDYGLQRNDVAARFPGDPAAANCGFITTENLPRGQGGMKLRVRTECGRIYFVTSEHRVEIEDGWIPKPPPPSPVRDLSTLKWEEANPGEELVQQGNRIAEDPQPDATRSGGAGDGRAWGERNILFALYGDFSANSALHVASFANELIARGYDCVVAVPSHKETLGALPQARFMAMHFAELERMPAYFRDGRGPCVVHAWTSRENVRKFTESVVRRHGSAVFVHLEDNEQDILSTRLGRPYAELARLPESELDSLVPEELSHPHRAAGFLASAAGVTLIVERLREHVPAGRPSVVLWPGADPRYFVAKPRNETLRAALGFAPGDVVLFYHGNTHTSNAAEVRSLYEAVALLNRRGLRAFLVRTGRDFPGFLPAGDTWIRPHLIHLGHIGRAKYLPDLMALADFFVQPGLPDAFNDYRFPSKLPEFFSIGRPVILPETNLGKIVRHGEDAWVLPRADAAGIAGAIEHLRVDPALVRTLSEGALAFSAVHFSWTRSTDELLAFYRRHAPLGAPRHEANSDRPQSQPT